MEAEGVRSDRTAGLITLGVLCTRKTHGGAADTDCTATQSHEETTCRSAQTVHHSLFNMDTIYEKSGKTRGRLPPIIFARIVTPMNALQLCS